MKKVLTAAMVILLGAFLVALQACPTTPEDTDGDGMPNSFEELYSCLDPDTPDALIDSDEDGLTNIVEYFSNSWELYPIDPCKFDTDGDGIGDGAEVGVVVGPGPDGVLDTTPAEGDSLWTDTLIAIGDNKLADSEADVNDQQVLPLNGHTVIVTDPAKWDTDDDMLPDKFELDNSYGHPEGQNLDPTDPDDADLDFDEDGNSNLNEYWDGNDPWTYSPVWRYSPIDVGCNFWADTDGDGILSPPDRLKVVYEIVSGQSFPFILPHNHDTIDLDADGAISPADLVLWDLMFDGEERAIGYNSAPASLEVIDAPDASVAEGSTTHVTLSVNSQGGFVPYSSGAGVVFNVSGNAVLLGGDGTDPYGDSGNRYDISMEASGGALASIVVLVTGPGEVTVDALIPSCGTYPYGRWHDQVDMDAFVINP